MTLLKGLQGICPKNFKHIQLSDIMLQHKTTPFHFCLIFITISILQYLPSFSDTCESPIGRSSQIFRMIPFKELKISSKNTSKITKFRQITRVLDAFLLPKLTDVTRLNFFEVARRRQEVRSVARAGLVH